MKNGKIFVYCDDVNAGVIKTQDGKQYSFSKKDWRSPVHPKKDMLVTFNDRERKAGEVSLTEIVPLM